MNDTSKFIKKFLYKPKEIGSIAPSSNSLALNLVNRSELSTAKFIIELGVGSGSITRHVWHYMPEESRYLGIEKDKEFVMNNEDYFNKEIIRDDANNLVDICKERGDPDRIISSLPWSYFSKDFQEKLLDDIVDSLSYDGILTGYLYKPSFNVKAVNRFNDMLKERFSELEKPSLVVRNLPPATIYKAKKR